MKKVTAFALALVLCLGLLAGCGGNGPQSSSPAPSQEAGSPAPEGPTTPSEVKLDKLKVYFVPSREPSEIITATEPLKALLKEEMKKEGYDIGEVEISVGTTYEAVGEALVAGTADVGLIPGGTYVLYDDGCDVILTATRDGLSKDFDEAKDWNDGTPTEASDKQAVSYRALMIEFNRGVEEIVKRMNAALPDDVRQILKKAANE